MADASESTPPPPLVSERLADFGDRLSPMLVKELRQGLRAKTFLVVFLSLQGLLLLILLVAVASSSNHQRTGEVLSAFIFMLLGQALLVAQPLRMIGTLHREITSQTVELMVLTRLSAWRIVLGKWISNLSQSVLLLAAVMPYLILRFWFGGMDLFAELSLMLASLALSATATAVVVGISSLPSAVLRALIPIVAGGIMTIAIPVWCFGNELDVLSDAVTIRSLADFGRIAIGGLSAAFLSWMALGIGASSIAPAAENHATPKRLVTLGFLVLIFLLAAAVPVDNDFLTTLVTLTLGSSILLALSEDFLPLPSLYEPFEQRRAWGRLAAGVLYPGWPSAVFFALLAIVLGVTGLMLVARQPWNLEWALAPLVLLGTLLMPAALLVFCGHRVKHRFAFFLLIVIVGSLLAALGGYVTEILPGEPSGVLWAMIAIPQTFVIMASYAHRFELHELLVAAAIVDGLYATILIPAALKRLRMLGTSSNQAP